MAEERPDSRPRPTYGEYAPEGWEWKPEGGDSPAAGEGSPAGDDRRAGALSGVPHNLGAGGGPAAPAAQPAAQPAAERQGPDYTNAYRAAAPGSAPAPKQQGQRLGDRVVTIILLVLGGCGALYSAAVLYQMPASFELMAAALEVDGFVLPDSIRTLGTVGALIVLAVYALNLLYSIQRMRRGALAFWVPLAAAVVSFIVVFAMTAIAGNQVPELMREMSEPGAVNRMIDYLVQQGSTPQ